MAGGVRRALIQVHLWIGIGLGLYILMMSVTGSAIVARRELTRHWLPDTVAADGRARAEPGRLRELAQALYPGWHIVAIQLDTRPLRPGQYARDAARTPQVPAARPVEMTLARGAERITRRFDPYSGADLGDVYPAPYRALLALVELHDNLLGGRTGRFVNGLAAIATTLLLLTGLIVWWPGAGRGWRASLRVSRGASWRTQLRQLHNTLAIWPFVLLLLWALSGIYFSFPEPFEATKDWFFPANSARAATGDMLLNWLATLHFGRFGGTGVRVAWIVLGLVPGALFVTGAMMWWYSVLQPSLRRSRAHPARAKGGA